MIVKTKWIVSSTSVESSALQADDKIMCSRQRIDILDVIGNERANLYFIVSNFGKFIYQLNAFHKGKQI